MPICFKLFKQTEPRAVLRAFPRVGNKSEVRIPRIATTINNSIKVKVCRFINISLAYILYKCIISYPAILIALFFNRAIRRQSLNVFVNLTTQSY